MKKGMKSVADPQNYGDEKPAIALLFPEKFAHLGLSKEDFEKLRQKAEVGLLILCFVDKKYLRSDWHQIRGGEI
jgi:hypothetical protein